MYHRFSLVLMLAHDCNQRCTYCYMGPKSARRMPAEVGRHAIDRAFASLSAGGTLELGFFGGEPLLEASLLSSCFDYAWRRCERDGYELRANLTTNGTVDSLAAQAVMLNPRIDVMVSCDGLPAATDRHRVLKDGGPTSGRVAETIRQLVAAGTDPGVVMVVRPDTLDMLSEGIEYLRTLGVRRIQPSLDLWAAWLPEDMKLLDQQVAACGSLWRAHLPDMGISWFDEKLALLSGSIHPGDLACGFGDGELAVAPSGRVYACERLIGADEPDDPMCIEDDVMTGTSFLHMRAAPARGEPACAECAGAALCTTNCRCSNYVRTGNVRRPDGLLCALNRYCIREATKALAVTVQPVPG